MPYLAASRRADLMNADLIHDLKAAADGFEAVSMLFTCAAARVEVVQTELV
jgi:hypothetical protein